LSHIVWLAGIESACSTKRRGATRNSDLSSSSKNSHTGDQCRSCCFRIVWLAGIDLHVCMCAPEDDAPGIYQAVIAQTIITQQHIYLLFGCQE